MYMYASETDQTSNLTPTYNGPMACYTSDFSNDNNLLYYQNHLP